MDWLSILAVAVGLAMDALAVALAAGVRIRPLTPRHVFRLSFHFGLFQFMMPIIGWFVGEEAAGLVGPFNQWIAAGLLGLIGGKMLYESLFGIPGQLRSDPTRGWALVGSAVATSIDALAAGTTMALMRVSVWGPSVVIGIITAGFTVAGMVVGSRLGGRLGRLGRLADALGGVVLVGLGLKIVIGQVAG